MQRDVTMADKAAVHYMSHDDHELSEIDEATIALVRADQMLRNRVSYLSDQVVQGYQLRSETIELMSDIYRLKKMDSEFHSYAAPYEHMRDLLHPLHYQKDDIDKLVNIMNAAKKDIKEKIGGMDKLSPPGQAETQLDVMLLSFIDSISFYVINTPFRH